jgi:type III pantothenate kinase
MIGHFSPEYLCLAVGNSRLHWAYFRNNNLENSWDTSHSLTSHPIQEYLQRNIPLYIASVVFNQTTIWQQYPQAITISLPDIPLDNLYPTLGIDRALTSLGAGEKHGFPCLVIDGGTALTFTGVDGERNLVGGAILAGLKLQLESLLTNTAALPKTLFPENIDRRWAMDTQGAITSGIIYTIRAGIRDFVEDWLSLFPNSKIVITGGDAELIFNYLDQNLIKNQKLILDQNLIFWGMQQVHFLDNKTN